jgi:hypothetical protein
MTVIGKLVVTGHYWPHGLSTWTIPMYVCISGILLSSSGDPPGLGIPDFYLEIVAAVSHMARSYFVMRVRCHEKDSDFEGFCDSPPRNEIPESIGAETIRLVDEVFDGFDGVNSICDPSDDDSAW